MAMKGGVRRTAGGLDRVPYAMGLPSAGELGTPGGGRAGDYQRQRRVTQPQARREHAGEEIGENRNDQNRDREMIDGRVDMPFLDRFEKTLHPDFLW